MKYNLITVKKTAILVIIAAIFSFLQLVSTYIFHYNTFKYSPINVGIFNLLIFITFFIIYFIGGNIVYWIIDRCSQPEKVENNKDSTHGLAYFLVIILGWSPWLYAFYPGSLWWDMCYEYDQYYGSYRFDSVLQFPAFPTYVMGLLMDIGKTLFKSDNVGMFLYIILQTLVCAFACTKVITLLEEIKLNKKIIYSFLLVYAFFPVFGASVQSGANNVLNYGLTLLSCVYIYRIYRQISRNEVTKRIIVSCFWYINYALLSSLWRKEMVYIYTFISILLIIYCYRVKFRRISAVLLYGILILCLSSAFSERLVVEKLIGQTLNKVNDTKGFSVPLLQVARFVYYHDDLVSDEEKGILNKSFSYGYDGIRKSYNPNLSDSLIFNFNFKERERNGFYRVYWSFFKKDPLLFLESLIASSYGYYSILPNAPKTINNAPTNGLPGMRLPGLWINLDPDKQFGNVSGIEYRAETQKLRTLMSDWLAELEKSLNAFFGFGICTFLMVVLSSYSYSRSKKLTSVIPYILPLMLCMVCIASPVNDYGRYYIGVFYCMPFIIGITMQSERKKQHA